MPVLASQTEQATSDPNIELMLRYVMDLTFGERSTRPKGRGDVCVEKQGGALDTLSLLCAMWIVFPIHPFLSCLVRLG